MTTQRQDLVLGLHRGEWAVVAIGIAGLVAVAVGGVLAVQNLAASQRTPVAFALLAGGLAIGALLALSLTLSQRTAGRVQQLRDVAAEWGLGDLSVRAPGSPNDDVGALGLALNAMADRIARVLQAQKDLLAGVSHELRSPLARMQVAVELVRQELAPVADDAADVQRRHEASEQLLAEILEEVMLLERHIERLLEAQRVGVDRVLPQRTELDLDQLLRDVLRRETHRLQRLAFAVEVDLQCGAAVVGDVNALDRVVSTLIENVVQHAGDAALGAGGGSAKSLRIESARDELGAWVRVLDRGPGLTPEQCPRVFEAFFRTDASRASHTGGTGLGLYLVKRISEAHGGSARAMPRPGGGLVIELRLPLLGQKELKETVKMQAVDLAALQDRLKGKVS